MPWFLIGRNSIFMLRGLFKNTPSSTITTMQSAKHTITKMQLSTPTRGMSPSSTTEDRRISLVALIITVSQTEYTYIKYIFVFQVFMR